jgi:hypothetical protein
LSCGHGARSLLLLSCGLRFSLHRGLALGFLALRVLLRCRLAFGFLLRACAGFLALRVLLRCRLAFGFLLRLPGARLPCVRVLLRCRLAFGFLLRRCLALALACVCASCCAAAWRSASCCARGLPLGLLALRVASRGLDARRLFLARDLLTLRLDARREKSLGFLSLDLQPRGLGARRFATGRLLALRFELRRGDTRRLLRDVGGARPQSDDGRRRMAERRDDRHDLWCRFCRDPRRIRRARRRLHRPFDGQSRSWRRRHAARCCVSVRPSQLQQAARAVDAVLALGCDGGAAAATGCGVSATGCCIEDGDAASATEAVAGSSA